MPSTKTMERLFLRRLYAVGKMSVRDFCDYCYNKRIPYSEGLQPWYSGGSMGKEEFEEWHSHNFHLYEYILEELLFQWWFRSWEQNPGQQLVPEFDTREQEVLFLDVISGQREFPGETGDPDLVLIQSIKWKFAPKWRARYKEIPKLNYFNF